MFKQASGGTSGVEVIFIVLLGLLFLCQTLGKLIMYLMGRFKYTAYNGQDIIEELQKQNHLDDAKTDVKAFDVRSSFYSYNKRKNTFTISHSVSNRTDLSAVMYSLHAVAYANEENSRSLQSRWQLIGATLLSIVPYLFWIGTMLLIYVPEVRYMSINGKDIIQPLELKYYLPTEILCVIGWVIILIDMFWWMSIVNNIEIAIEDLTKQLNNKNLRTLVYNNLKLSSYIPFSFRTII